MSSETEVEPIQVLISHEELLFVLDVLQARSIPGLDDGAGETLTQGQRDLALAVAGRALRARDLARAQGNGAVTVQRDLLTAVGVCAYSQRAVFVYHWPAPTETPQRFFGHIRGDEAVVHTHPEAGLHRFTLLPTTEQLVAQLLSFCQYADPSAQPAWEASLPRAVFGEVRGAVEAGDGERAAALLAERAVPDDVATALIQTLSAAPRVSILQTIRQAADTVRKRDFTLLQSDEYAWCIIAGSSADGDAPLLINTMTPDALTALLLEWV